MGLAVAVLLATLGMAIPAIFGWDVHVRWFPPLHAIWDPRLGAGTLPALLVGALAIWQGTALADRLPVADAAGHGVRRRRRLAVQPRRWWTACDGVGTILDTEYEYLDTARATSDLPAAMRSTSPGSPTTGCPTTSPTRTGRCTSPGTRRAR